ncbi:MAG: hypothetical protein ACJAS4_003190 [Bacteriovoracaceae bacterium]|jgi:hypothetical protein
MKKFRILILLLMSFSVCSGSFADESAFDSVMDEPTSVEDEAKGELYIHQGIADKKVSEMCADGKGGYKDICDEDQHAFAEGGMRTLETLLPALTKAYAMFSMMGGSAGGFTANSLDKEGNQIYQDTDGKTKGVTQETEGATEKTENKPDYCGYIAMVGEGASAAYTLVKNEKTEENFKSEKPEARQAASFYALADNHKTMEKGAKVQMGVWSATAACYVAYATQAAYQGDWKVYAKMAAAGFIGLYYKKKADAHGERADLLEQMAKDLPSAGDCNPFSNKSCFCAEETSIVSDPINFRNVCLPEILAKRTGDEDKAFVCADASGNADLECDCIKSNTCADRKLKIAGINLGLGPTVLKDPLAAMKPISKGFGGADVDAAANRNLALANKTLKKFNPEKAPNLNNDQKKIANELFKNGIPKAAAAYLAKGFGGSGSATLPSSALSGLGSSPSGKSIRRTNLSKNKKGTFKSGGTIRGKSTRGRSAFGKFGKKKGSKNTQAIHIEDFAKKAEREAEIVTDTSKGIFDIISYRYKVSAWREFKDVMKGAPVQESENKDQ